MILYEVLSCSVSKVLGCNVVQVCIYNSYSFIVTEVCKIMVHTMTKWNTRNQRYVSSTSVHKLYWRGKSAATSCRSACIAVVSLTLMVSRFSSALANVHK